MSPPMSDSLLSELFQARVARRTGKEQMAICFRLSRRRHFSLARGQVRPARRFATSFIGARNRGEEKGDR